MHTWYIEWTHPVLGDGASTIKGDRAYVVQFVGDMEAKGAVCTKVVQEA